MSANNFANLTQTKMWCGEFKKKKKKAESAGQELNMTWAKVSNFFFTIFCHKVKFVFFLLANIAKMQTFLLAKIVYFLHNVSKRHNLHYIFSH